MAASALAVWRVRAGGNNANGGGYDCSLGGTTTGTHGVLSGVTFTDATAANFVSGMVGRSINITSVGQYLIATFISSTQITLAVGASGTLPQLSGGASWTIGAGTDFSQQNAAQVVFNGSTVTASTAGIGAVITFSGYAATAADVGNVLHITGGTNFTAGWYFITAQAGTTWTLDRNCTTGAGAAMTGNMGGGWADFVTNTTSSGPPIANHNTVYIRGAGTPNPASYAPDYTLSASWTAVASDGDNTGYVTFANDPGTPGYKPWPDTTGGMPLIKDSFHGSLIQLVGHMFQGLWFFLDSGVVLAGDRLCSANSGVQQNFMGCVFDQNSIDAIMIVGTQTRIFGCEFFSSSGGSAGSNIAVTLSQNSNLIASCNFHNLVSGIAIRIGSGSSGNIIDTIVAKNLGVGIDYLGNADDTLFLVKNCTIDANGDSGIRCLIGYQAFSNAMIMNNIISNHITAGFGIAVSAGTAAQIAGTRVVIDYNTFFGNTTDMQNTSYGPHDTHGGANPYTGQSTQNYTLA